MIVQAKTVADNHSSTSQRHSGAPKNETVFAIRSLDRANNPLDGATCALLADRENTHLRDASYRKLIFLDLMVGSSDAHVPRRTLADLMQRVGSLYTNKKTHYWRNKKTRKIYLGQFGISSDGTTARMLIKCTTGNIPDESFADLQTDAERLIEMGENEGKQESVHLLLSQVSQSVGQAHRYFAVLEAGDVLTRGLVEDYLGHLMRKVGQADPKAFSWPLPSGEKDTRGHPKKARYHSTVELQGHPADDFKNDLAAGRLTGIELIKALPDGVGAGGEAPYVREDRLTTRLAARGSWKDDALERLKASIGLAKKDGHDSVRVRFSSADKMSHTVEIDPDTENVLGDSFVKKIRIGPFTTLKQLSCQSFDPDILQPMIGLLNQHRAGVCGSIALNSFNNAQEIAARGPVPDAPPVLLSGNQKREQERV